MNDATTRTVIDVAGVPWEEAVARLPMVLVGVIVVALVILTILLPMFVYIIANESRKTRKLMEKMQFDLQRVRTVATGGK